MPLDKESQELLARLKDLEDRIISDEEVEQIVHHSLASLEVIFGQESILTHTLSKVKAAHKLEHLDQAIQKSLKRRPPAVEVANAAVSSQLVRPDIAINKNSVISDFLVERGNLPSKSLQQFQAFFKKSGGDLERALAGKNSFEAKNILKQYIDVLEAESQFLEENKNQMLHDIRNVWSLQNQLAHELAHWVYLAFSEHRTHTYYTAMNEAYSFALQKSAYLFSEGHVFTSKSLLKHILELYQLIVPRKKAYAEKDYIFMRSFILLISILILCDAIARKNKDFRNKELFLESYAVTTINQIYALIEKAIDNIGQKDYKKIIKTTLLKTAKNQLKKCKKEVIKNLETTLNKLPDFRQKRTSKGELVGNSFKSETVLENWKDLKLAVSAILKENTSPFIASLDLLIIIDASKEAVDYKARYLKALQKLIEEIVSYSEAQVQTLYETESDLIAFMINIIKSEEKILSEIISNLSS
ncbi:MAG: hypothetical protein WC595_01130 [Candidatus Nanoarchaeia archaeon]